MPEHTYVINEQPTTAQVNAWVRDQVVTIETAANIAAISAPTTGRHAWDSTNKVLLRYDGSNWVPANVPVFTAATLPASPKSNAIVFDSDAATLIRYDGAAWSAVGTVVCTSSTRPGTPRDGQVIAETDTDRVYVRQGSNWCPIPGAHVATAAAPPSTADGVMHFMSDRRRLLVRNGSAWETVGPFTCTSSTRPTNPADGDQIWETDTDRLMVYDGSNWVIQPAAIVDTAVPANKMAGTLAHETTGGTTQLYSGSAWLTLSPTAILAGNNSVSWGNTYYGGVAYGAVATEAEVQIPVAFACTVSNLYLKLDAQPGGGGGGTVTLTVRKNTSDTTISAAITGTGGTTKSDTTHTASFAVGDLFSMKIAGSGTGSTTRVGWSVRLVAS